MFITDLSIRRPVVSAVFSMILVVFGLFVFWKLPVRELPSGLQPPVVQIQVDYQGASAEIISSEIVEILEDVTRTVCPGPRSSCRVYPRTPRCRSGGRVSSR